MNFIDEINKIRSDRSFLNDPVPDEVLIEILEAARVAP
jgi:nitroreductase